MARRRMLVVVGALLLVAAACGGDDGADPTVDTQAGQDGGSGTSGGGSGGSGDGSNGSDGGSSGGGGDSAGAPEIDPGDMPAPGEIVMEVDGQTFTVTADDVDYFECSIDDTFVNVRAESASQNWTVQVDPVSGRANASLELDDAGIVYTSFAGPEVTGGASVEPPHVLYEARFESYSSDDLGNITELGTGRAAVTCP